MESSICHPPFFSVLVPIYNQEKYISECIESVLNQSFNNFELVLIDDGSTDSSGEICDQYMNQYPKRVTVIHKKNEGLLFARKTGIEVARGMYYLFLDGDDCFRKDAMEVIYKRLEVTDAQMVIFNASFHADFETKVNNYPFKNGDFLQGKSKIEFLQNFCGTHLFNNMCFKCIHSSLFDLHDYIDGMGVDYGEDLFQSIPLVDRTQSICILQTPLYFYRQHAQSMTHYYHTEQFESIKIVCKRLMEYSVKWKKEYAVNLDQKAQEYAGNECYRNVKNILKSNDTFVQKHQYLIELRRDPFYEKYIKNHSMRKHLRLYEKGILILIELNSYMIEFILNLMFLFAKQIRNRK